MTGRWQPRTATPGCFGPARRAASRKLRGALSDSLATCARAAYRLVDGHALLTEFGTPSATLVPSEVWSASRRGRLALLRLAPARYRFAEPLFAAVESRISVWPGRFCRDRALSGNEAAAAIVTIRLI